MERDGPCATHERQAGSDGTQDGWNRAKDYPWHRSSLEEELHNRNERIPSPSPPIQIFFQSFPKTQPTIFSQWIDFPGINNRTPTSMEWMIHNRVSVGISICSLRSEIPRSPSPPPLWRNRGGLRDRTTGWLDHHWERFRKLSRKVSYRVIVFDASYIKLRIDRVSPTGNVATKKSKNCSSFKI